MDLDHVRKDWTVLGQQDPLWAVLIRPGTRNGGWDPQEFLATGRQEVAESVDHLRTLGALPSPLGRVLDFGCGAGRLTQALAAHAEHAVGIDISEPMIRTARSLDPGSTCEFVLNEGDDLAMFDDASFDLVYSSLVLQHMPLELAIHFLQELCRVLRPGGALVVQVSTKPTASVKGFAFRYAPQWFLRWAQTRLLGYPAPMRMQAMTDADFAAALPGSARVVDVTTDDTYGGHWIYHRHYVVLD